MKNNLIGLAGELRIASELALKGHNSYKPLIDEGIDLILDNGLTIQVKTVLNGKTLGGRKTRIQIPITGVRHPSDARKRRIHTKYNMKADFIIVWIANKNNFFVIPTDKLTSLTIICVSEDNPNGLYRFLNKWELLERSQNAVPEQGAAEVPIR